MSDNIKEKVILITGAGRGMGTDIAKATLAAGYTVVATGRDPVAVKNAAGDAENLLAVKLDVTNPQDADAAVKAALDRFGRIDVLINNAGNFYAGFFEEISPENFRAQIETNLFGPVNVTRAVLPIMRRQRSGFVVTISSTGVSRDKNSSRPTPPRSLALRAGWSHLHRRLSRSASEQCL